MTERELARLATRTAAMQAQMVAKGFGCHCPCSCAYVLGTEHSRAQGRCFSCRAGVHYGSKPLPMLEATS